MIIPDGCKTCDHFSDRLAEAEREIVSIRQAFPDGDMEGHRRYHETMIEMLQERRRLRRAIAEKTISGLIWAALVWLGAAVIHEFQDMIMRKL